MHWVCHYRAIDRAYLAAAIFGVTLGSTIKKMVKVCVVSGCSNRQKKGGVSFFSIPGVIESQGAKTKELSSRRRTLWLARINRKNWSPSSSSRVCGDHFISGNTFIYDLAILIIIGVINIGRPSVLYNELNPDWASSINMGYSIVSMDTQRYHRLQNRKRKIEEQESLKKRRRQDKCSFCTRKC